MVDITPGDSGANKGFWRVQLRDRYGKFVKMGGAVMFEIQLEGVQGKSIGVGYFIGNLDLETARIEVRDNKRIPKGVYLVKRDDITAIEAVLPEEYVESKKIKMPKPADREREREALGWYTDNGYWDANKFLREGVPLDTTEDEENLAILLQMIDKSVTTEDMTLYRGRPVKSEERAAALAALKPGDKITDRGIMSTSEDRLRAKFYTDTPLKDVRERVFFEIDLPAGSRALKIEDTDSSFRGEYEVLLPPNTEFTIQDNFVDDTGVRRIKVKVFTYVEEPEQETKPKGTPLSDTTWDTPLTESQKKALEDYASGELALDVNTYLRTGESYFYPKEEGEPESMAKIKDEHLEELKQKIEDLSSAFDGAVLAEDMTLYRSLDDPSFGFAYDLDLKDGEVLDLSKLEGTIYTDKGFISTTKDADFSYSSSPIRLTINAKAGQKAIDLLGAIRFDSLQREQEVIFPASSKFKISKASYNSDEGKYYIEMDYLDSTTIEPEPEPTTQAVVSYPDRDHFDVPALDPKTSDQIIALSYYTGETTKYVDGHKAINTYLRTGKHYEGINSSESQEKVLKRIDALKELVNSQTIDKNTRTFRYQGELSEGLGQVGNVWVSDGFLSTSTATTRGGDETVETEFGNLPIQIEVNIPAGSRGGAIATRLGTDEGEVLLPPGSKFLVQSVEEVDERTKVSLLLVEQDELPDSDASFPELEKYNANRIALDLDKQYILRFLNRIGPQLGSNDGGTFRDSITSSEYYVKTPKSEEHRRNEMLASALYRLTNIGSAGVRFGSDRDGVEKTYSAIIPGKTLAETDLTAKTKKEIQAGFAIDAWLANWDVAGLEDDNIIIDSIGRPYRIDMGGALLFRAQGAPKGEAFGDEVTEIDTLRDPNRNPASAALFGDMTYSELVDSASKLLDISPAEIDILVDATFEDDETATELKNKLKARRDYILKRFNLIGDDKPADSEPLSVPDYSSIDYEAADFSEIPLLDESKIEKRRALMYYTGDGEFIQDVGHHKVNTWLRKGEHYPSVKTLEEQKAILDYIDILQEVVNSSTIDKDMKVLRYQATVPEGLGEEGAIWTSDGFLSTSAATSNGKDIVTAFTNYSIKLEINIPKGSRGGAVDGSLEAEVLLPPGSRFLVQSVEKTGFSEKTIRLLLVGQDG